MVFLARSDWSLKPGKLSAIDLPAFFWILRARFVSFLSKKGAILCWLYTGLIYTKAIIHLHFAE